MSRLFQITEDDLAELERLLPDLQDAVMTSRGYNDNNRIRVQLRRVKDIVSNLRWNYGPPTNVGIIPVDGSDEPQEP